MNPLKEETNVTNEVVEKAALLSENIVRLLLASEEESQNPNLGNSCSHDLSSSVSSIPRRGNLDQFLWKESSRTLETAASASIWDGATSNSNATTAVQRSPSGFLMQELGNICKEGHCPKSAKALDHPELFQFCTPEQRKFYGNDVIKAVADRDVDALRNWHQEGRPLFTSNEFGETMLHMACRRGYLDVVAFLVLEAHHTLWVHDEQGKTPLHLACHNTTPLFELVDFVIRQDPGLLFVSDMRGSMPLDYAPRDTWSSWISYLKQQEFRNVMPRRQIFFTRPKEGGEAEQPTEHQSKVIPFLDDIDRILTNYSSKKKKKKKKHKESKDDSNSHLSGAEPCSSEDDAPPALKLKRKITSAILETVNSSEGSPSSMDSNDLQDLTSLAPEELLKTLQRQRRLSHKLGGSASVSSPEQSEEGHQRQKQQDERSTQQSVSSSDTAEKRVKLLKQIEELQILQIRAKTSMNIAMEMHESPDSILAVLQARMECERLESEICDLQSKLHQQPSARAISSDMMVSDCDMSVISEVSHASPPTAERPRREMSESIMSIPIIQEIGPADSGETTPTHDSTTDDEEPNVCMCVKLRRVYGSTLFLDNVRCRHVVIDDDNVDLCHLQLVCPVTPPPPPAKPKEDEEEDGSTMHVEASSGINLLRGRSSSIVRGAPERHKSPGPSARHTSPAASMKQQRRKSFGGSSGLGIFRRGGSS